MIFHSDFRHFAADAAPALLLLPPAPLLSIFAR
jgi:hypothetical protein